MKLIQIDNSNKTTKSAHWLKISEAIGLSANLILDTNIDTEMFRHCLTLIDVDVFDKLNNKMVNEISTFEALIDEMKYEIKCY